MITTITELNQLMQEGLLTDEEYENRYQEIVDLKFEKAIQGGRLSREPRYPNYAGNYMYMGSSNGRDLFKNSMTRKYDV